MNKVSTLGIAACKVQLVARKQDIFSGAISPEFFDGPPLRRFGAVTLPGKLRRNLDG